MGSSCSLLCCGWSNGEDESGERSPLLPDTIVAGPSPGQRRLGEAEADGHHFQQLSQAKEQEALARIVTKTAENLIDIFSLHQMEDTQTDKQRKYEARLQMPQSTTPPRILQGEEGLASQESDDLEACLTVGLNCVRASRTIKDVGPLVVSLDGINGDAQ